MKLPKRLELFKTQVERFTPTVHVGQLQRSPRQPEGRLSGTERQGERRLPSRNQSAIRQLRRKLPDSLEAARESPKTLGHTQCFRYYRSMSPLTPPPRLKPI